MNLEFAKSITSITPSLSVRAAYLSHAAAVLGRIALALIFVWSGYGKLVDPTSTVGYMNAYGVPLAHLLVWPAAVLEVGGGLMLITGWNARWAAVALAGFTAIAAFTFHNFWAVSPEQAYDQGVHFLKNVAIAGGLLQVYAAAAGRYTRLTETHTRER